MPDLSDTHVEGKGFAGRHVSTVLDESRGLHKIVRKDGTPISQPRALPPKRSVPRRRMTPREAALVFRPANRDIYNTAARSRPEVARVELAPAPDPVTVTKELLRQMRVELGMSALDAARSIGKSRGLVTEIELGRRDSPKTRVMLYEAYVAMGWGKTR